jgi:transposase
MNKLIKKKWFIGVDISNATLDLALMNEESYGKFTDQNIGNSLSEFDTILKWLEKEGAELDSCLFCMEHTGTYGLLFFAWLSQIGIDFCVEPGLQIKRSLGITRGKNDKIDARRIAEYACSARAKLKTFSIPSVLMLQIKQLLTYREQSVRIRTSLKNSLKSHTQYQKISGLTRVVKQIESQINQQDLIIKDIEKEITEMINSNAEVKKNFELITSIKGIGLIISAFVLVTTNNFTSFENGRKYACYTGIAPFEYSSGTSIRGKSRVSHLGNKTVKKVLSNGANSAITFDPEIRAYYKRKTEEGKDHKLIINAVSCKLVNRMFAVVKRQTPYITTYQQKILA